MRISSIEDTTQFCRDIGIQTIQESNGSTKVIKIVMKAGPISITQKESITRIQNPGRSDDLFVFGELYHKVILHELDNSATSLNGASKILTDSFKPFHRNNYSSAGDSDDDDWETKYENEHVMLNNNGDSDKAPIHTQEMGSSRFDSDNLLIPPSWLLWALLR